ncbi:MAG: EamA family transporter [Candidatus Aenigmatarchaeota archaeon]
MFWIVTALFTAFASATKDYISKQTMKKADHYLTTWSLMTLTLPFLAFALIFVGIPQTTLFFWFVALIAAIVYIVSVLLYMKAISISPLSLTLPMLAFTPIFMLLTGPLILGEFPNPVGIIGIISIVVGAYVLNIKEIKKSILHPFIYLVKERGPVLMLGVSALWSITATSIKYLINSSNVFFGVFSEYLIAAIIFSLFVFLTKRVRFSEVKKNFKNLTGIGFFMALSEVSLSYTFTMTLAVYAIAVKRTSILIGSFYGFKFFKEGNVLQRVLGSVFMLLGIILMAL